MPRRDSPRFALPCLALSCLAFFYLASPRLSLYIILCAAYFLARHEFNTRWHCAHVCSSMHTLYMCVCVCVCLRKSNCSVAPCRRFPHLPKCAADMVKILSSSFIFFFVFFGLLLLLSTLLPHFRQLSTSPGSYCDQVVGYKIVCIFIKNKRNCLFRILSTKT